MLERYFQSRRVRVRIGRNRLAEQLAALAEHLDRRGHTPPVIQNYVQAAEHFGYWLGRTKRTPKRVDAASVRWFLTQHLGRCECPRPHPCNVFIVRAALHQLLVACGTDDETLISSIDLAVAAFESHLQSNCGLTMGTRHSYIRFVREFLSNKYGTGDVDLATITLADISTFVTVRGAHLKPGSANVINVAVRSFMRYLQLLGFGNAHWFAALPGAARWRLAALPTVLSDAEVSSFLGTFDRDVATGRRGYAIALCFLELGLRVAEVAQLALDDIDWRMGVLRLGVGKSRRVSQLPLPDKVASALAEYLKRGRPTTVCRAVFVHHRAPLGEALGPSGVRGAVRVGYARAGLNWTGTHVLRRTAATRMLRAGVSLKAIADVLGHRSLDTSAIYTKVDQAALVAVALPWPQVKS